jgi:hypothetical protein
MSNQELRRRLWVRLFPYFATEIVAGQRPSWQPWWLLGQHRPPRFARPLPDRRRRLYDPRRQRH